LTRHPISPENRSSLGGSLHCAQLNGRRGPSESKLGMRVFFPILILLLLFACTVAPSSTLTCALPKNQGVGSLHGQWLSLPVSLVFDKDFYVANNGDAMPSLRSAVGSWNVWAQLKGHSGAYSLKNDGTGSTAGLDIPALTDCSQASYSASLSGTVGVWKITGAGDHTNQRASCGLSSDGSNGKLLANGVQGQTDWIIQAGRITGASILLNFADYNSPGRQALDVESLLLHELGHVLGLLHSCNGSSGNSVDSTTAPACFSGGVLAVDSPYANAVMFPFLEVSQLRRNLTQNDLSRVNCLY
jgi:hypothetical protein